MGGDPPAAVCKLVDARAAGGDVGGPMWCEWPDCPRVGVQRHHRLDRGMGGRHGEMRDLLNGVAWLLKVCVPHHMLVTNPVGADKELVESMGWVLLEGQHGERVPVLTRWWAEPVWLWPDGTWSTYDPLEPPGWVA